MMNVQPAEEESEAEVRRVDQDNINKFARLNARLHELRDERDMVKVRENYTTVVLNETILSERGSPPFLNSFEE